MGKVPYRDFFDHHLPARGIYLPYSNGFHSDPMYYFVFGGGLYVCLFVGSRHIYKKRKSDAFPYYMAYFFIYPFITVYYWTHLFIADSLAFLFFSVIFWLLVIETFQNLQVKSLFISCLSSTSYLFFHRLPSSMLPTVLSVDRLFTLKR